MAAGPTLRNRLAHITLILALVTGCGSDDGGPAPTLQSVSVTPASVNLAALGATASLSAAATNSDGKTDSNATLAWGSSDPTVASVSGGSVTAVSNGTATITVTATSDMGSATGTATVVVHQEPAELDVSTAQDSVEAGQALTLEVSATDAGGAAVAPDLLTWSSSDTGVATVDTGVVTAVAPGNVTITATGGPATSSVDLTVFLLPLAITTDTTLSGTVTVGELTVAAGRTVTVEGALELTAFGDIDIAGSVIGDCTPIALHGNGDTVSISGTVRNTCSGAPSMAPDIEILMNGELVMNSATIDAAGPVSIGLTTEEGAAVFDSLTAAANGLNAFSDDPSAYPHPSPDSDGSGAASYRALAGADPEFTHNCNLSGTVMTTANGTAGEDGGAQGSRGGHAGWIAISCYDDLRLNGSDLRTGQGGDGGSGNSTEFDARARGGHGGSPGYIALTAGLAYNSNGALHLTGSNKISVGGGGSGGAAYAHGQTADAIGGAIGYGSVVLFESLAEASLEGSLSIELRKSGNGGNATAIATKGTDAGTTEAIDGGNATAYAGTDRHQLSQKDLLAVSGIESFSNHAEAVTWSLRGMGYGGHAIAEAGNGGNGNEAFPDGAEGGKASAWGAASPRSEFIVGDLTMPSGAAGNATIRGGNGGLGWNGCSVNPFKPGGSGGDGGEGYARGGNGFDAPGIPDGEAFMEEFGNGGRGGDGVAPGIGGLEGSAGPELPVGSKNPNLQQGGMGVACATQISLPFGISITVKSDPAGHEPFVAMTGVTGVTVTIDTATGAMSVSGPGNWIAPSGTVAGDDSFSLTGSGTAAGYPNTGVSLIGALIRDGDQNITGFTAEYTVGTTGNLPTGQPVTYNTTAGN